jgi:hypothetical protein
LTPIGARTLGLGNAVAARSWAGALFANPAAVAESGVDQLLVHTAQNPVFPSNTFSVLIHSEIIGTIGVTYRLVDLATVPATDESGNETGELHVLDHVLTATYATIVTEGLRAGLNYTLFQYRNDCRGFCGSETAAATTHLIDAGVQYRVPFAPKLELGAALLHVGFPLQVVNAEQAAPSPSRFRMGVAHEVLQHVRPDSAFTLWLAADVETAVRRPGEATASIGAELAVQETLFLWGGFGADSGLLGGPAIGVGLRYDRFLVGVSQSFGSDLGDESNPFQVTFGIRF